MSCIHDLIPCTYNAYARPILFNQASVSAAVSAVVSVALLSAKPVLDILCLEFLLYPVSSPLIAHSTHVRREEVQLAKRLRQLGNTMSPRKKTFIFECPPQSVPLGRYRDLFLGCRPADCGGAGFLTQSRQSSQVDTFGMRRLVQIVAKLGPQQLALPRHDPAHGQGGVGRVEFQLLE